MKQSLNRHKCGVVSLLSIRSKMAASITPGSVVLQICDAVVCLLRNAELWCDTAIDIHLCISFNICGFKHLWVIYRAHKSGSIT